MISWKELKQNKIRFIEPRDSNDTSALEEFAVDDAIALSISNDSSPQTIRLWQQNQTVVLGIPDAKLPYISDSLNWLEQQGFNYVVRNSGGLAVVLDHGVLNISLLLAGGNKIGIHQGYELMVEFIRELFADLTDAIEAYEIKDSYCPGDYDLSINGKKFAGISQRRVRNGVAVQIYLSIEPDNQSRAKLIQHFYALGLRGEEGKFAYPTIEPTSMEALATLLDEPLTTESVIERIKKHLHNCTIEGLNEDEMAIYQKRREQMVNRNQKALGNLFKK